MGKQQSSSLTIHERKQFEIHHKGIGDGLKSYIEVGEHLRAIRDGKLFTDISDTFEGYCKKCWSFTDRRARQIIDSSKSALIIESLATETGTIVPVVNEAQARVLSELPDEQTQANVWAKAVESAPKAQDGTPKVTAAIVKKAAAEIAPKADKPKPAAKPEPEAKPAKGKPTIDLRKFAELESHLGKAGRMNTDLLDHCGGKEYHEKIRVALNQACAVLATWRKHSGAE